MGRQTLPNISSWDIHPGSAGKERLESAGTILRSASGLFQMWIQIKYLPKGTSCNIAYFYFVFVNNYFSDVTAWFLRLSGDTCNFNVNTAYRIHRICHLMDTLKETG